MSEFEMDAESAPSPPKVHLALVLLTAFTTTYRYLWSQATKDIGTISSRKIICINEPIAYGLDRVNEMFLSLILLEETSVSRF